MKNLIVCSCCGNTVKQAIYSDLLKATICLKCKRLDMDKKVLLDRVPLTK